MTRFVILKPSTLSSPKLFLLLHAHQSRMDTSWDEYDAYDLSEFSAEDFVYIDNTTTGAKTRHNNRTTVPEEEEAVAVTGGDWTRVDETGGSGGLLQVAVELDSAADEPVVVKVAVGGGGSESGGGGGDSIVDVDGTLRRSPFEQFRSETLSVSDLVGPAWYVPPPPLFLLVTG
jgi:hypothetical protein